jgi:translation elongation factor EF-1alpha
MVKKKKAKTKVKKALRRPKAKRASARKGRARGARPKKAPAKVKAKSELSLEKVGEITHYFPRVKAAVVTVLKDSIRAGDNIYIKGHTTDFKEKVQSMQLDHTPIEEARKGQEIGLLVKSRVRIGDSVYRL